LEKTKKPKDAINVKEEPEPKIAPETIEWTPRPLAQNGRLFLGDVRVIKDLCFVRLNFNV
jgi:hypothetical protein